MTPEPMSSPAGHICAAQDTLTDIRISLVTISAAVEQLNAQFENHMSSQEKDREKQDQIFHQFQALMKEQGDDIVDVQNHCRFPEKWLDVDERLNVLEIDYHKRGGSSIWTDRLWNILQAVGIALVVALTLFFMKGGHIV